MATNKQIIGKIEANTSSTSTASWIAVGQNFALQRQMAKNAKVQNDLLQAQLDQQWQASFSLWRQTPEGRYFLDWRDSANVIKTWLLANNSKWDKIRLEYFANDANTRTVKDAIKLLNGQELKPAKKFRGWLWVVSGFGVLVISNAVPNLGSQLTPFFLIYLVAVLPFVIRPIMKKRYAAAFTNQSKEANRLLDETEWAMSAENISCLAAIGKVEEDLYASFPTPADLPNPSSLTPVFQVTIAGHPELSAKLSTLAGPPRANA
ncbi:MAG: hypothetical protein KGL72_01905 [Actinomycetales bacterium]|nr:hypothetical protein [Actinomycetales bacterium]